MTQESDPGGTRRRLLEAAVRVGARDGWSAMTTRAVAAEAGVGAGLVHYHVGSVDRMRRDAVDLVLADVAGPALEALLAGARPPAEVLTEVVAAVAAADDDRAVLVHEAFGAARHDPALRAVLRDALDGMRGALAGWLDAVQPPGPDRLDPAGTAALVAAAVDGIYLHRQLGADVDVAATMAPVATALARATGGAS